MSEVSFNRCSPLVHVSLRNVLKQGYSNLCSGGRESEALLPYVFNKPPQDAHHDPILPRRDLQPSRPALRPPAFPLQHTLAVAVQEYPRQGWSALMYAKLTSQIFANMLCIIPKISPLRYRRWRQASHRSRNHRSCPCFCFFVFSSGDSPCVSTVLGNGLLTFSETKYSVHEQ